MDLSDEEAKNFDPNELALEELERRRALEDLTQAGAEATFDLQSKGALYQYVLERRRQAASAITDLVDIDPKDAIGIAVLQTRVREYISACDWINRTLGAADDADHIIHDEFPADGQRQTELPPEE
jgi:hypothetical protein